PPRKAPEEQPGADVRRAWTGACGQLTPSATPSADAIGERVPEPSAWSRHDEPWANGSPRRLGRVARGPLPGWRLAPGTRAQQRRRRVPRLLAGRASGDSRVLSVEPSPPDRRLRRSQEAAIPAAADQAHGRLGGDGVPEHAGR